MEKEYLRYQIHNSMKDNTRMVLKREEEFKDSRVVMYTRAITVKANFMDKVFYLIFRNIYMDQLLEIQRII